MPRLPIAMFLLLFVIPFTGVGVYAAWAVTSLVRQSSAAAEWVAVSATVEDASLESHTGSKGRVYYTATGRYRYAFGGKAYTSTKLGLDSHGATIHDRDWHKEMVAYLVDAKEKSRTITAYVDPADPSRALLDRDFSWSDVSVLVAFGGLFGTIGVGSLVGAFHFLRGPRPPSEAQHGASRADGSAIKPDGGSSVLFAWLFALGWNAIAIPGAAIGVPRMIADGEYWGLFVLIFPLVGLLLIWGALASTWRRLRHGDVRLVLRPEFPVGGQEFSGVVQFARGVAAGSAFKLRLQRTLITRHGSGSVTRVGDWSKEMEAKSAHDGPERKIAFTMHVPAEAAPREVPAQPNTNTAHEWRLELLSPRGERIYGFEVPIRPAPAGVASGRDPDPLRFLQPARRLP